MVITLESRKYSFPSYFLIIGYVAVALIFKDRWQYLLGLSAALVLFLGCYGIGKRASFLVLKASDQNLYFPIGLGIVLLSVYAIGVFSTSATVIYGIWLALLVSAGFEAPVLTYRINRSFLWAAPLVIFSFWITMTPVTYVSALSHELGVPHLYLALGKIQAVPDYFYTSFPPFGHALGILFSGLKLECGLRVFSVVLFFNLISVLAGLLRWLVTEPLFASRNSHVDLLYLGKTEWIVIPALLLPCVYAHFHFDSFDCCAAMFFCAGVSALVKEFDLLTRRKLIVIALLFGFGVWTKLSVILYVALLPVLWFSLNQWRLGKFEWRQIGTIWGVVFLAWLPLMIRNAISFGDPIYPALSGILPVSTWSASQSLAFVRDHMASGMRFHDLLLSPLFLIFKPGHWGDAAQTGAVLLISLAVYPFSSKIKAFNQILFYCAMCFIAWIAVFRDFGHFFPVLMLVLSASYFSFRTLFLRRKNLLPAAWSVCAISLVYFLFPLFSRIPLILPSESQQEYLNLQLDYVAVARKLPEAANTGKLLLLGEERIAYFYRPVLASTRYDEDPLPSIWKKVQDPDDLFSSFRQQGCRFVLYNQKAFRLKHGAGGSLSLSPQRPALLEAMLAQYGTELQKSGEVRLYELKGSSSW